MLCATTVGTQQVVIADTPADVQRGLTFYAAHPPLGGSPPFVLYGPNWHCVNREIRLR